MRDVAESAIKPAEEALARAQKEIDSYNTYTFDSSLVPQKHSREHSPLWRCAIQHLQLDKRRYIQARLFALQLEHATVRYEKRTQWVHIKICSIPPSNEADSLFSQLDRLSKLDDKPFRGTREEIEEAISQQMEVFMFGLRVFGTGPLKDFNSLHNSERFQAYEFRVSYDSSSPQMCATLFRDLFEKPPPDSSYFFVSAPEISGFPNSRHKIVVYIDVLAAGEPEKRCRPELLITPFEPYSFCLICFQSGHGQSSCEKRKYGYDGIIQN